MQIGLNCLGRGVVLSMWCLLSSKASAALMPGITLSNVSPSTGSSAGYASGDINSVSISRNNLATYGNYQYATYYGTDRYIYVARRDTSGATPTAWQTRRLSSSTYQLPTTGATAITDDHNVIAMAIDGTGFMHLSWGMHNVALNMATSNARVDQTWDTSNISFTKLASVTGQNESTATYPEFYKVPGSSDLLLFYRDGGAGGGSGNGNEYINRYNATTKIWSQVSSPFLRGIDPANPTADTGYNGYLNSIVRDATGALQATWTWRETPDYQTNHDLMYAKSTDNGVTWKRQDGTAYVGPITKSNAQIFKAIDQSNSLINNAGMTVDQNNNPIVATWYAPGHDQGNDVRQYMLEYYDGDSWETSQITHRPGSGSAVRDLGRPIVLVDDDNRVIVIYRSVDASNNGITAAYSLDRVNWSFLTLSNQDMGQYEPSFDQALWDAKGILNLFYQPSAVGQSSAAIQVLQWDAKAYFAAVPEPATLGLLGGAGLLLLRWRTGS